MPFVKSKRTYYKNVYQDWEQPVLTANGTLGGDSFAVVADSVYGSDDNWKAFDNDTSTIWHSGGSLPHWVTMYNPNALKVDKLIITTSNSGGHKGVTAGTVVGSNDNENWEYICDWTNDVTDQGATWEIAVNSSKYYKYYKLNMTKTAYNPWLGACAAIGEIKLTAQETYAIPATLEDYDFFESEDKYYILVRKQEDRLVLYEPVFK